MISCITHHDSFEFSHAAIYRNSLLLALFSLAAVLLLPTRSTAQQATLTDDAQTSATAANQNFGTNVSVRVSGANIRGFFKFTLTPNLPAGTTGSHVGKATFKLFVGGVTAPGAFDVFRVAGAWDEATVTGSTAPPLGVVEGTVTVDTTQTNRWVTLDVTQLVKDWLDAVQPNNGIAVVASGGVGNVIFNSKENQTTSHEARLEVILSHAVTADRADSAAIADTANSLSGTAVVPGSQVSGDISGRASSITGTVAASQVNGTVAVVNGGTGLSSTGTAGNFLRSNGSTWTSTPLEVIDIPAGSANYIQNSTTQQAGASLNISGSGTFGSSLLGNVVNTATQYNIAGQRVLSTPGMGSDIYVGINAGNANASVSANNSFFGFNAGPSNTTGNGNSFFGTATGFSNTTGISNSFYGAGAGNTNISGSANSFFGNGAGGHNTEANNNSFFGVNAGFKNTSGSENSFFGILAAFNNTTGSFNTFVGRFAGFSNTTEDNNTFIGADSNGAPNISNATAIGSHAQVTQSNSLVLGSISGVNNTGIDTNVGIGTTAPTQRLEVKGNIKISGSGTGLIFPDGTTQFSASSGVASDLACAGCVSESELFFDPATQAELDAHKSSADHDARYVAQTGGTMTGTLNLPANGLNVGGSQLVLVGGNVGIGTVTPAAPLEVEGITRLRNLIATPQDAGLEGGEISLQGAPGFHSWQMDNYGGTLRLHSQGVARLEVTNAGNVGIGTDAPANKLEVVGNVRVNGNFVATGSKSAVVTLPDNSEVLLYAVESPGNWFEDFGHATLSNGVAHVEIDSTFAQTINTEMTYHVFLTPNGDCKGLYVARKTATSFEVRELGGGQTNVTFDYRIVARRKGYENVTSRSR